MSNDRSNPSSLIADQIAGRLHQIFDDLISVPRTGGLDDAAIEQRFLTRSYAALSLLNCSDANVSDAAQSVTDGGDDDGIDAIYISETRKRIFLVQSKWLKNTQKGISLHEFTRFRDGVKRLINLKWDEKNKGLHRYKTNFDLMMKDIDADLVMVFAHNSEQGLSEDILRSVSEFLNEINQYGSLVAFEEFDLRNARETARSRTRPENINLTLMLKHWGMIGTPFRSVYGAVSGTELVSAFEAHRDRLFAENLRFGIEKSEVNDGIRQTAHEEPQNFWYFNNGVTAICDDIFKQPVGGNNTDSGVFDIKKISVINGAQTISSLTRAKTDGANIDDVVIHLRIISLSETPENFSTDVTTANNTQNDLNPIDFVAADQNQDRIRREASQLGLVYVYRRGDQDPSADNGFTVREATVAAACASGELRLAVSAKRYISGLWENTKKEPYTKLFNEQTSANWLWGAVRVQRVVDQTLETEAKSFDGRLRLIAVHSNRFVLFLVFQTIENISNLDMSDTQSIAKIQLKTKSILSDLQNFVESKFPDAYPGNIFKNTERQSELLEEIRKTGLQPIQF